MSTQTTTDWQKIGVLEDFPRGTLKTVKRPPLQLVVAHTEDGELYALDNRCPHEGYPLAQGDLKGVALTCCWHNWKFDVRDGACVLGGEGVRAFPLKVEGQDVLCDLTEPDPSTSFPAWKQSLELGLFKHDNGRAIRDGVRLLRGGYSPFELLGDVARYDADQAEYGTTHVLPVCADVGRLLARYDGTDAMYAIAPAIDLCGETHKFRARRPRPEPLPGATGAELRAAVEAEEVERAEALLLGAYDAGVPQHELEQWLYACLSDHFLDFGHPLIYLVKLQELLRHGGAQHARALTSSLLVNAVYGTREDTLPYLHAYASFVEEHADRFEDVVARADDSVPLDERALRDAVLDARGREACEAVWRALESGVSPARIARVLVAAAAHRFLRFDVELDSDPDVAENWIWVTHRFTFASAVRNAVERFDSSDAVRFLFQSVAFTNSGRPMDAPEDERVELRATEADARSVLEAISEGDAQAAVERAAGVLASPRETRVLRELLEDLMLADAHVRPIVVAHVIKTGMAAFEEYAALGDSPDAAVGLLAVCRFLASPVSERRVNQLVRTSLAWVDEGRMPRKLTQ